MTAEALTWVAQVAQYLPKTDFNILWQSGLMTIVLLANISSAFVDTEWCVTKIECISVMTVSAKWYNTWPWLASALSAVVKLQQKYRCIFGDQLVNLGTLYLGPSSSWSTSGWTLVPNIAPGGEGLKKVMIVPSKFMDSSWQYVVLGVLAG